MPLSFLIPGTVQAWFGPGLAAGRVFAVLLGMAFLLGLWLLARRLGGRWWAAGAAWAFALNPAAIKMYSVGVSQGLIAAMLVWTLWLTLGNDRKLWQILAGSALAGLMALTRLNMTPVLFLLVAYLWWQHGRRTGLYAAAAGGGVWLLGHALFWPGILGMWANYTPRALTPFLDAWRIPADAQPSWISDASLKGRWLSLLDGLRFNFVPLVAGLGAALLWPERGAWKDQTRRRTAVFLAVLFALLLAMHAVASLGGDYCVSCFPLYTAFFGVLGVLLLIVVWPERADVESAGRRLAVNTGVVLVCGLVGYGAYGLVSQGFPTNRWVRQLLIWEVPRLGSGESGTLPLWGLLENAFGWVYADAFRIVQNGIGYALLALAGVLVGLGLLWAARLGQFLRGYGARAVMMMLVLGLLLSPTALLGGGYRNYDCDTNMITAYERQAAELDTILPPGALVFWRGNRSAAPLLYLPDIDTYPAQLNGDYTYRLGGDTEELVRMSQWGPGVLEDWLHEADYILVEEDLYRTWLQAALESGPYDLVATTAPLADCSPRSAVLVYRYAP
jgi:hypothetical protein